MSWLDTQFQINERGSRVGAEITAGATTFFTMSYIIFVEPVVLSMAGMDFGAVMTATCIASAIACFLMAFLANYPIALAPAMGHNFFFAFTACGAISAGGLGLSWQQALAAVLVSGLLFLALATVGFREKIIDAIPKSLRYALAVGIGLLIAMLGLQWGGIVVGAPGVLVGLGDLSSGPALLTIFGTFLILALMIRGFKGAIFIGMVVTTVVALSTGMATYHGLLAAPPSLAPTLMAVDISGLFGNPNVLVAIAIFFFLDLFDTVGTLIGLAASGNLLDRQGKLPKAERALAADAGGTVAGALLGTSTITSFVESAAGIATGGRTGLASLVTGILFLLALFFYPLVKTIGGGYEVSNGLFLYPIIAPSLIVVGGMMISIIKNIEWDSISERFPAYLTIIITPLTFSITEGISAGFISYSLLKTAEGKFFEVHPLTHLLAALFVARYIFLV